VELERAVECPLDRLLWVVLEASLVGVVALEAVERLKPVERDETVE
jgi:hypothetical protein